MKKLNLSFEGRARRSNYLFVLACLLACYLACIPLVIGLYLVSKSIGLCGFILSAVLLAGTYVHFVFGVRRLHDLGLSGWYILISFIPVLGLILHLVMLFMQGENKKNKYGPDPKVGKVTTSFAKIIFIPVGVIVGFCVCIVFIIRHQSRPSALRPEVQAFLNENKTQGEVSQSLFYLLGFGYDLTAPESRGREFLSNEALAKNMISFEPPKRECKPQKSCIFSIVERKEELKHIAQQDQQAMHNYLAMIAMPALNDGGSALTLPNLERVEQAQRLNLSLAIIDASEGNDLRAANTLKHEFDFWFGSLKSVSDLELKIFILGALQRTFIYSANAASYDSRLASSTELSIDSRISEFLQFKPLWDKSLALILNKTPSEHLKLINRAVKNKVENGNRFFENLMPNDQNRITNATFDLMTIVRKLANSSSNDFARRWNEFFAEREAFCNKRSFFLLDSSRAITCLHNPKTQNAVLEYQQAIADAYLLKAFLKWKASGRDKSYISEISKEPSLASPFDGSAAQVSPDGQHLRFKVPKDLHITGFSEIFIII